MDPFDGYKIYGPYLHSREKRRYVQLVKPGHRTTISYARYLMCVKLNRLLDKDEEVDHIDNNKLNDDLSNLQILSKAENVRKGRSRTFVDFTCPQCDSVFSLEKRQTHKKRKYPACCSRSCSGKYQRQQELKGL